MRGPVASQDQACFVPTRVKRSMGLDGNGGEIGPEQRFISGGGEGEGRLVEAPTWTEEMDC